MDDAVEAGPQRVRDHLRRPIPGRRNLLIETAGNTDSETDPLPLTKEHYISVRRGSCCDPFEQSVEVVAVEAPVKGARGGVVSMLERGDLRGEVVEVCEVIWGEQFALDDGAVDLNLVEPRCVHELTGVTTSDGTVALSDCQDL